MDNHLERDRLIVANLYIVRRVAESLHAKLPRTILLDDLIQEGCRGLIKAVDTRAVVRKSWEGYVRCCIRGAILDALKMWQSSETQDRPSRSAAEPLPDEDVMAGWSAAENQMWLSALSRSSAPLFRPVPDSLEALTGRQRRLVEAVLDWTESKRLAAAASTLSALGKLTRGERQIIRLVCVDGYSCAEIAQQKLVSIDVRSHCRRPEKAVQRMYRGAVGKLREALKAA